MSSSYTALLFPIILNLYRMPHRKQYLPYLIYCCKSRPLNFACIQGLSLDHFVLLSLVGHFTIPRDIYLEQKVRV